MAIDPNEPELTDRERQVLEAVVRSYVASAEPAGSRTLSRDFELGVSPATVRNTMSDLEAKGYLFHPHTSAGRVPTDQAYRFFVDRLIGTPELSDSERRRVRRAVAADPTSAVERLIQQAARALSVLSMELGVAVAPSLHEAVLEKLDFLQVSSDKVLLIATVHSGLVRTVYVDLPGGVPQDTLVTLAAILNERLAGLTLTEIRETLGDRLRDTGVDDGPAGDLLNIFMQSSSELFSPERRDGSGVHLGRTSLLASQPEFTTRESLTGLIELTERTDLLAGALERRNHSGGLHITIGGENTAEELNDFTLVTAEYRVGGMQGVIGVIGPTRMPYEKVIAIVDYTSRMVTNILTN